MSLKKLIDLDLLDRFLDKVKALIPAPSTNIYPKSNSAAQSIGTSLKYSREDHVHPSDNTRFSLHSDGTMINSNDNLNDKTTVGNYYCSTDARAETLINSPVTTRFKMVVLSTHGTGNYYQLLFPGYNNSSSVSIYYRFVNNGVWSAWKSIDNPSKVNGHTVEVDVPSDAFLKNILAASSRTFIPYNSDLNDYTTAGIYYADGSHDGSILNAPSALEYECYCLYVIEDSECFYNDNGCYQIILFFTEGSIHTDIYIRSYYHVFGGGLQWSNWINIASPTTVNGHTVLSDVPANAVFTDTTYESKTAASGGTDVSLVTTGEKATWNAKGTYSKPSGGIPDSDIASAATWNAKGTYSKPSGGIPDSDIASAATWNAHAVTNKGSAFASGLYKITTNSEGHVTGATAVAKSDITALGIPESDTTYTPASANPLMDGTAAVGTSTKYAREDHVHPRDSKVAALEYDVTEVSTGDDLDDYITPGTYYCKTATIASNVSNIPEGVGAAFKLYVIGIIQNRYYQLLLFNNDAHLMFYRYYYDGSWFSWHEVDNPSKVNGHTVLSDVPANAVFTDTTYTPASANPLMDGTAAVGTSTKYAREDHVHPRDEKVFSLVEPTNTIPEGADLDGYYTAGTYLCPTTTRASTLLHAPDNDDAFVLVVMRIFEETTRVYQFAFINSIHPGVNSATIYFRYYATVWSDWFDIRNPSSINGHTVLSDVPANLAFNGLYYGECDTAASTAAKVVTLTNGDGFSLVEGAKICVKFANANSASDPTLNVNDTGAKPIMRYGTTKIGTTAGISGDWSAGGVVLLVFDGTNWIEHYWHNNTYSSMTVAEYTAGTGTTARLMTAARLKAAIKMHSAPEVYTATIPTTGWTTASYGAYIDVTFTDATFEADDTVFVDLNLSDDTNLQLINDSWACLLRATPTASSAVIRFKFREIPTVAIPVRAVVT